MRKQALIAGGLLIALLAFVLLLPRRNYLAQQTLSDGTKLTLVAVKAGTRHDNPRAPLGQKIAAFLPASFRARLKLNPPESTSSQRTTNYMTVWLISESRRSEKERPLRIYISDDRGNLCINDGNSYSRQVSVSLGSNVWLQGLPVLAWPRRSENLHLHVYSRDDSKLLAEFQVKNPGLDLRTPGWKAPPWPVTVRNEDLDFTLTSLWLGVGSHSPEWKPRPAANPIYRETRAAFEVTKHGSPQTNWYAYHVREIRDATDNCSHGDSFSSTNLGAEILNEFGRPPLPADDAWQMTVEFSRLSGFSPEELHTVTRVPVPPIGQSLQTTTNRIGKHPLEIRWDTRPEDKSSDFGFWATVLPPKSDYKLSLLRATDDHGRQVPVKCSGGGQSVTYELLRLEPDASFVDLDFAFHRSRIITFQVKPEILSSNSVVK